MQIQPTQNFGALKVNGIPVEKLKQIQEIVSESAPGVEHLYRAPEKGSAVFNAQIATQQYSNEEFEVFTKIRNLLLKPKSQAVYEADELAHRANPNIPIHRTPDYEIACVPDKKSSFLA